MSHKKKLNNSDKSIEDFTNRFTPPNKKPQPEYWFPKSLSTYISEKSLSFRIPSFKDASKSHESTGGYDVLLYLNSIKFLLAGLTESRERDYAYISHHSYIQIALAPSNMCAEYLEIAWGRMRNCNYYSKRKQMWK